MIGPISIFSGLIRRFNPPNPMSTTQNDSASSQTNKVHCKTCGSGFARERNLRIHEAMHDNIEPNTKNTPQAIAKRLKCNTDHNTNRWKLRKNDPVYREKERQISITNRMNKKAAKVNDVEPKDVSTSTDVELDDPSTPIDVGSHDSSTPIDVEFMSSCVILCEDTRLPEKDGGGGSSRRVKKPRILDSPKDGLRVQTTALTTQNVMTFFAPKWSAPRSRAQRLADPRHSAI